MNIETVCPAGAPEPVTFAACELRAYLTRMLGEVPGDLTVRLEVRPDGGHSRTDWFSIELDGAGGAIVGDSARGPPPSSRPRRPPAKKAPAPP